MFNGSKNLAQHLAHYIFRCGSVINGPPTVRDTLLLQLFVQPLEGAAFTWYGNLPKASIVSWEAMEQEFLRQFCNTQRRVGVPELIETKQREGGKVTNFIARWRGLIFECLQRFTQHELVRMCLNNFRHDLSTTLIPQTFEGFNNLCTKAHDIEIHLNKQKKSLKERPVKPNKQIYAVIMPQEKDFYKEGSSSARRPYLTKPGNPKKPPMAPTLTVAQTSHQSLPKPKNEDKRPSLQERQARDYSFKREKTRELFEELLEQNILALPEIRCPNEAGRMDNPKYCP